VPSPHHRSLHRALVALLLTCFGCGPTAVSGLPDAGAPASIERAAGEAQQAAAGTALAELPTVRVRDESGRPVEGATVTFTVTGGSGWVSAATVATDATGRASTTWYLGPRAGDAQRLGASVGGALTADFAATATSLEPGTTYHGAHGYVEFTAGALPLIVSAPHGGALRPEALRDRTGGTHARDTNTEELAREIAAAFTEQTGAAPHTVIVRLHRIKVDANREIVEAAEGGVGAERAWREYHSFLEAARAHVQAAHGRGLYIDLHGHGHAIPRLELGYLLSAAELNQDDGALNGAPLVLKSSLRSLAGASSTPHAELVRGPTSLGTLFEQRGFPAVPSSAQRGPGQAPYFSGGYNTRRYGSAAGGATDGVQIEANMTGVRDTQANRRAFALALVDVMDAFFTAHFGRRLTP